MPTSTKKFSVRNPKVLITLALLVIAATFTRIQPAHATGWTATFTDNFTRADGAIGNSWTDSQSLGSVSSNHLHLLTPSNIFTGLIERPSGESAVDQRATVDFLANNTSDNQIWMAFRTQTPGTEYIIGYNGHVTFAVMQGDQNLTVIGTPSNISPTFDATHQYTLDAQVVGTNPTTLSATMTDDTTSSVVSTNSATDSTSNVQQAGRFGMFGNSTNPGNTVNLDNVVYYQDNVSSPATTYSLSGPSTVAFSTASSNFTVAPNGLYTGTITPSDGSAGGTFSPTSLTFSNSASPQTFTYSNPTIGTKTISTTSSPALTNPSSVPISVSDPNAGKVSITNSNLVWSPYDWHFNGSTWAETQPGGGYVKVAFTGSTLGINVDNSALTVSTSGIGIDAWIDGASSPIQRTLANTTNGLVTFTTSLSAGNHYAIIYNSVTPCNCDTRWQQGQNALRITSLQLANDGSGNVASLTGTPLAKKAQQVLFYGDSITEGYADSGAEYSYAADLGKLLGVEYGQAGYRGGGYGIGVDNANATFYNIGDTAGSWWSGYDNALSRLNGGTPSGGYKDGVPAAVFNNLGINDAATAYSTSTLRTKITDWMVDERTTIGQYPAIILIMPYSLADPTQSSTYTPYHTAILGAFSDYQSAHPSDSRVYMVDLGTAGFNIVAAHSAETVHPDDTGASLLANMLQPLVQNDIITPVTAITSVASVPASTTATVTWTTDAVASSIVNYGLTTSYGLATSETDTSTRVTSHTVNLSSLAPCTVYHYDVVSKDIANDTITSADNTFTTTGCTGSASVSNTSTTTLTASSGGGFTSGSLAVSVPANAIATNITIQNADLNNASFIATAGSPANMTEVGTRVVHMTAFNTSMVVQHTFLHPLTLTLTYSPTDVSGLDATTLQIYRYDSGTWTALSNCVVDTNAHTVACQTSNFSDFALFAQTPVVVTSGGGSGGGGPPTGILASAGQSSPVNGTNPVVVTIPTSTSLSSSAAMFLVKDGSTYYVIQNGSKFGVTNPGILKSYGFTFAQATLATDAEKAIVASSNLTPNDGALVKTSADPTVYLISGQTKLGFASAKVFTSLGYSFSNVLVVTAPELNVLAQGNVLATSTAAHPAGTNIKFNGTVYLTDGTTLHPYPSLVIYNSWNLANGFSTVVAANAADEALPIGSAVQMRSVNQ